jgi:hopanoid biosynthesis associated protein HpnK
MSAHEVVITADDFGKSSAVNEAIMAYHRAGALHQASLMVAEPGAEEAAALAHENPGLRVGLHLTLCDGAATQVSRLTDPSGRLIDSPARAGWRYALDRSLAADLEAEIRRQFERFRSLGLPPTYWDGHTHLHLHPRVFALTLPIAREYGFTAVRLVREPGPPALIPWIFQRLSRAAIPRLQRSGITFHDRVIGLRETGRMNTRCFREALATARALGGTTEIYFHPGAELEPASPTELAELLKTS